MQSSSIRGLILRAHLLEMFLSIAFFGMALFMWYGRSNSDVSLLAGAALIVAGAMVFFFAMKSILKYSRHR
jgi:membrane protein YdbS with pleckstrin-like domain